MQYEHYTLMIWERIPTHSPIEHAGRVRVLPDRTEVEHPKLFPVSVFEEFLRVLSMIAVQALYTSRWVTHDNNAFSDVHQICQKKRKKRGQGFNKA
jgi:hypothetical protein